MLKKPPKTMLETLNDIAKASKVSDTAEELSRLVGQNVVSGVLIPYYTETSGTLQSTE